MCHFRALSGLVRPFLKVFLADRLDNRAVSAAAPPARQRSSQYKYENLQEQNLTHCHTWPGVMSGKGGTRIVTGSDVNGHLLWCAMVFHGLQCGYILHHGPPWAAGGQLSHSCHATLLPVLKYAITETPPALLTDSALGSSRGSIGTGSIWPGDSPCSLHTEATPAAPPLPPPGHRQPVRMNRMILYSSKE